MKRVSLLLIVGLFIFFQTSIAQISLSGSLSKAKKEMKYSKEKKAAEEKALKEKQEAEKDYPLLSRFEGAEKLYENTTKWEEYKLPLNSANDYLQWEAFTKLEGKIIRIQYSTSSENNPAYVLKMYEKKLKESGFEVLFSKKGSDIGLSSGEFSSKYYNDLGNSKFGFKYLTKGKDHGFIAGKIIHESTTIFAAIYISGFDDTTLITQDIIEAETIEEEQIIATPYRGSSLNYNDKLGYGEFYVSTGKTLEGKAKITKVEGNIQNRFFRAPEGRSALEIIKNYEAAITKAGGQVLIVGKSKEGIDAFMKANGHPEHRSDYNYMVFKAYEYFCGVIHGEEMDYFVVVAAGKGEHGTCYHLVTVETKPMELDMVADANINENMLADGHMAFYDILFETGNAEIKSGSEATLNSIANFLKSNTEKKYYIVGHTDNTGDFETNLNLAQQRATSIMNYLIITLGANNEQLAAYGVSSLAPVANNATPEGKAKNRRVEIVEQ